MCWLAFFNFLSSFLQLEWASIKKIILEILNKILH